METGPLSLSKMIRGLLLTGAVAMLPLQAGRGDTPAVPDQAAPPPETTQLGKIEVTGTRIRY